jgi:hypothetical protein
MFPAGQVLQTVAQDSARIILTATGWATTARRLTRCVRDLSREAPGSKSPIQMEKEPGAAAAATPIGAPPYTDT